MSNKRDTELEIKEKVVKNVVHGLWFSLIIMLVHMLENKHVETSR